MPCPFPGMDPYIERPAIWADFHDTFISCIRAALIPLVRPRYAVLSQDRLYVVEEVREPYLTIIEPAAGNRVVTAIEVLSPTNKAPGDGRDAYLQKRDEFWDAGANLVEIDLLRAGEPTVRLSPERLATLPPWTYLVGVSCYEPPRQKVYHFPLTQRLPRIAVPLAARDSDVPLDLQAVFTRCWNESSYPELLRYDGPPPGRMTAEELAWCDRLLTESGMRAGRDA